MAEERSECGEDLEPNPTRKHPASSVQLLSSNVVMRARKKFNALVAVTVFCLAMIGCERSDTKHARALAPTLRHLYQSWASDGRPESVDTAKYITSSSDIYTAFTNVVTVASNVYHCRFGVRSPNRFSTPGVLAITDEGVILWVGEKAGDVIVAPETTRPFGQ